MSKKTKSKAFDFQAYADDLAESARANIEHGMKDPDAASDLANDRRKAFKPLPGDVVPDKKLDAEDQPREENGRFGSGGGGESGGSSKESVSISKPADPKEFHEKFEAQMKDSPFTAFVSHYSPEELAGMKTLTNKDGTAGVAIKDHGDGRIEATALFAVKGAEKGAGIALLKDSITNHGVNYVECYSGQLDTMYAKLGFEEASRDPFNKEYASKDWNYERFKTPDYVTMRLKPSAP